MKYVPTAKIDDLDGHTLVIHIIKDGGITVILGITVDYERAYVIDIKAKG